MIFRFADLNSSYHWEYSELARNVIHGNGYSLFYFDPASNIQLKYNEAAHPFISAYMPPGYVCFLLPFLLGGNVLLQNISILMVQAAISLLSIFLVYRFTSEYFSTLSALIAAGLAAFLPDFIYSVISFTPTVIYHTGTILLLFLLYRLETDLRVKSIVWISILAGVMIYFRSEFSVFVLLTAMAFLFRKRFRDAAILAFIVSIIIFPWMLRNYSIFHAPIAPFTTNMGQNLYRGNNPYSIGDWGDEHTESEIKKLKRDNSFELEMSRVYSKYAISYMREHPAAVLMKIPVKLFNLLISDPENPRSGSIIYLSFCIGFFLLFLYGLWFSYNPRRHLYLYLFLLYFLIVSSVFLVLPRYQTMMRIGMLPFAAYGAEILLIKAGKIFHFSRLKQ